MNISQFKLNVNISHLKCCNELSCVKCETVTEIVFGSELKIIPCNTVVRKKLLHFAYNTSSKCMFVLMYVMKLRMNEMFKSNV